MMQINSTSHSGYDDHPRYISRFFFPGMLCVILVFVLIIVTFFRNNLWISTTHLLLDTCLKSPKKSRPFNSLGTIYADLGQYDLAIANFIAAINNGTGRQDIHYYNLGLAYMKKGDHHRAVSAFQEALGINPVYIDACYQLGVAYRNTGRSEDAIKVLSKAISLDPNRPGFYNDLGGMYFVSKKYHLAKEAYLSALKIKPDYSEALYNLALVNDAVGEARDAIVFYELFIEATPEGYPGKKDAIRRLGELLKMIRSD